MYIHNENILFLIFEKLQDDSKSFFLCLMANKYWCEIVFPLCYDNINYSNESHLFIYSLLLLASIYVMVSKNP
jgi:hypothetical protein